LGRTESHVERRLHLEAKAPRFVGELHGRKAEVEKNAVDWYEAVLPADALELAEVLLDQFHTAAEAREVPRCDFERHRISVEAEQDAAL